MQLPAALGWLHRLDTADAAARIDEQPLGRGRRADLHAQV